jgi:hypothetical protein
MPEGEGLLDEGRLVLAAVESYIKRSEDRAGYRREHGRDLSKAHKAQLTALLGRLDALRDRLKAILGPDAEELRAQFERLSTELGHLEETSWTLASEPPSST